MTDTPTPDTIAAAARAIAALPGTVTAVEIGAPEGRGDTWHVEIWAVVDRRPTLRFVARVPYDWVYGLNGYAWDLMQALGGISAQGAPGSGGRFFDAYYHRTVELHPTSGLPTVTIPLTDTIEPR